MSDPVNPSDVAESDIAIVGMAAHLPGAPDIATYWENLRDGVESIRRLSEEELLAAGESPDRMRRPNYVPRRRRRWTAFEDFDAEFFGFSPEGSRDHGPAAPPVPGSGLGGAGERGPPARDFHGPDRRLRRLRHGQLFLLQHLLEPAIWSTAPACSCCATPATTRISCPPASATSSTSRGRASTSRPPVPPRWWPCTIAVPVAAERRMRHGAGGRRDHRTAAGRAAISTRRARSCRPTAIATPSTTARRARCSAPARAWWCCGGWRMRSPTATTSGP